MKISAILLGALIAGSVHVNAQEGYKKESLKSQSHKLIKPGKEETKTKEAIAKKTKKRFRKTDAMRMSGCGRCGRG